MKRLNPIEFEKLTISPETCKGQIQDILYDYLKDLNYMALDEKLPKISITSLYRDEAYNHKVGGVPDSSHTKGLAVDIFTGTSGHVRLHLLYHLMVFTNMHNLPLRCGISPQYLHVDFDKDKPESIWVNIPHLLNKLCLSIAYTPTISKVKEALTQYVEEIEKKERL